MNFIEIADPVKQHKKLNPKLWADQRLRPEVRDGLLRIAEDFRQYIDVPFKVIDVVITGGNANFTYTRLSDIDLHLIADFDSISCNREAEELFDSKRLLYKTDHDVKIYGIPVELYVEDSRHPAVSLGSYSVEKNDWIRRPDANIPDYDHAAVEHMVNIWHTVLKEAMKTGDLKSCRTVLKMLKQYRKLGLRQPEGEFSVANLVYKSLRNDRTIRGLQTLIDRLHNQDLSIR